MKSILDPTFRYTKSVETDLRKTFARVRRELSKQQAALATSVQPMCRDAYDDDTIVVSTQAECERSHVKLDACAVQLGAFRAGNHKPPFAESSEDAVEGHTHG